MFRRICYPPAWNMRIYYPINDEEPTPALPKGGSRHPPPTPPQGRGARDKHLHPEGATIRQPRATPCGQDAANIAP